MAALIFDTNQYWIDLLSEKELEVERLREALSFYADAVSYENATPRHVRPVIKDSGQKAREALRG